jgi:hypothetical protein
MLAAFLSLGVLGCALEQGAGDSQGAPPVSNGEDWSVTEEWLDSCRRWCGLQVALDAAACYAGEAIVRGVPLGQPLPATVTKSYDLECIDQCLASHSPEFRCWRQAAEANDCYASEAVFVCDGEHGWAIYGCLNAGEDPSICDQP